MGRLDRYLLAQLLTLFGFFSLVLVALYWINRAVRLFDTLIANGQSALVFLEFSLLALPNVVRVVLPIAAFAAAIYVANRMRSDREIAVAQAAGCTPARLLRPVAVFGLLSGVLAVLLSAVLAPMAAGRLEARTDMIAEDVTAGLLTEGEFLEPADGITVFIRRITPDRRIDGLFLRDARGESDAIYTASGARLEGGRLIMTDGLIQQRSPGGGQGRLSVTRFDEFSYAISGLTERSSGGRRDMDTVPTLSLLTAPLDVREQTRRDAWRLRVEAHDRLSDGVMAAALPPLGFAILLIGGFSRFSAWREILSAIGALICLELLKNVALDAALGATGAWPLIYLPALLAALATWALVWASGRSLRPRPA